MIYAVKHNKVNRAIYKANEDALTSSIFERFMYLPKELFQHVLKEALLDVVPNLDLHTTESIEYWPNWNPEDTTNKNRVEPDVFIRTETKETYRAGNCLAVPYNISRFVSQETTDAVLQNFNIICKETFNLNLFKIDK